LVRKASNILRGKVDLRGRRQTRVKENKEWD